MVLNIDLCMSNKVVFEVFMKKCKLVIKHGLTNVIHPVHRHQHEYA